MPGAINLHYTALMDPETKTMRSQQQLEKVTFLHNSFMKILLTRYSK